VTFTGWRKDVPAVLAAFDVFVMPSTYEGGPTSVLEAMAMALPVVATRVGMVPEVIADGVSGLVVPPADVAALAAAVVRLVADGDLRAGIAERAHQAAHRNFSIDEMVERYLRAFAAVWRRPRVLTRKTA
jgi:glycosyltransferase involved in cell wall biosynthesis